MLATLSAALLNVLEFLHRRGWCHGDFKPSNVLLLPGTPAQPGAAEAPESTLPADADPFTSRRARVVLADFGLSARVDPKTTSPSPGLFGSREETAPPRGTASYCSPESFASSLSGGISADVWALGVLLWEVADGNHPLTAEFSLSGDERAAESHAQQGVRQLGEDFWGMSEAIDGLPDRVRSKVHASGGETRVFWEFVQRCLEIDPTERPGAVKLAALGLIQLAVQ